jgi:hypothetical protein
MAIVHGPSASRLAQLLALLGCSARLSSWRVQNARCSDPALGELHARYLLKTTLRHSYPSFGALVALKLLNLAALTLDLLLLVLNLPLLLLS